jgi:hypothetical protein
MPPPTSDGISGEKKSGRISLPQATVFLFFLFFLPEKSLEVAGVGWTAVGTVVTRLKTIF